MGRARECRLGPVPSPTRIVGAGRDGIQPDHRGDIPVAGEELGHPQQATQHDRGPKNHETENFHRFHCIAYPASTGKHSPARDKPLMPDNLPQARLFVPG